MVRSCHALFQTTKQQNIRKHNSLPNLSWYKIVKLANIMHTQTGRKKNLSFMLLLLELLHRMQNNF